MKKFFIVDENGNVVFSSKSEKKTIGWMPFNTEYDTETYTGKLQDGRIVRFQTMAVAR